MFIALKNGGVSYMGSTYYGISDETIGAIVIVYIIVALGIAIGLGCACRVIMKNKGYDNLGAWFCCGFFLGVIGIIICAVMQDRRQQFNQFNQQYGQPPYNQPPYGQPPYGQPPYGQPPYNQPPYGQPMMNQQPGVRCEGCGMINAPGTKFCSGCGNKLN